MPASEKIKDKFRLGCVVATPAALNRMRANGVLPRTLLDRHVTGDWGECGDEDTATNNEAVANEGEFDEDSSTRTAIRTGSGACIQRSSCSFLRAAAGKS